jgi:hypothetical protein
MHLIHIDKDEDFVKIFKKKSPLKRDPTRKKKDRKFFDGICVIWQTVKHVIIF